MQPAVGVKEQPRYLQPIERLGFQVSQDWNGNLGERILFFWIMNQEWRWEFFLEKIT